jgi:hypothetical protein
LVEWVYRLATNCYVRHQYVLLDVIVGSLFS